jgi:two-component system response regulator
MTRTLLLVEDDRDDEALILRALRKSDLEAHVVVAHDGIAALDYLHGGPGASLPQVVLLDLNLPRLGGLEVLRRIRADPRTRVLPVVVLTSSREERDISRSYALGATSYVRKPISSELFADAIRQVGSYWLELNELDHSSAAPTSGIPDVPPRDEGGGGPS